MVTCIKGKLNKFLAACLPTLRSRDIVCSSITGFREAKVKSSVGLTVLALGILQNLPARNLIFHSRVVNISAKLYYRYKILTLSIPTTSASQRLRR